MQADGPETYYVLTQLTPLPSYQTATYWSGLVPNDLYPKCVKVVITRDANNVLTLTSSDPSLPDSPYISTTNSQFIIPLGKITGCYQGNSFKTSLAIFDDGHMEVYNMPYSIPVPGFDFDSTYVTASYPKVQKNGVGWTAPPDIINIQNKSVINRVIIPVGADQWNWSAICPETISWPSPDTNFFGYAKINIDAWISTQFDPHVSNGKQVALGPLHPNTQGIANITCTTGVVPQITFQLVPTTHV